MLIEETQIFVPACPGDRQRSSPCRPEIGGVPIREARIELGSKARRCKGRYRLEGSAAMAAVCACTPCPCALTFKVYPVEENAVCLTSDRQPCHLDRYQQDGGTGGDLDRRQNMGGAG